MNYRLSFSSLLFLPLFFMACASDAPRIQNTPIASNDTTTQKDNIKPDTSSTVATKQDTTSAPTGRDLFNGSCASCHNGTQISDGSGPALGGVSRRRTKEWLYAFTRNSTQLIISGDTAAINIFERWNKLPMTAFPHHTDQELDSIYSFIEAMYQQNKPVIRMRRFSFD
jgi:mono/diheme cytochrome c family protein